MKYYKWSTIIAFPITIMALIIALLVKEKDPFVMNLCISIFASGLLVCGTSIPGYLCAEQNNIHEYYWSVISVINVMYNMQTRNAEKFSLEILGEDITAVNSAIREKIIISDMDYFFPKQRPKIQKVFETHNLIHQFYYGDKNKSAYIEMCYKSLRANKKNSSGAIVYTIEMFKNDIREFADFIDHYADTNEPFVCHLSTVAEDLRRMISTNSKKSEAK